MANGKTNHSELGLTMKAVLDYCEENDIPYILKGLPGAGYEIIRITDEKILFFYRSLRELKEDRGA